MRPYGNTIIEAPKGVEPSRNVFPSPCDLVTLPIRPRRFDDDPRYFPGVVMMVNAYRTPDRLNRTSHLHLLTGLRSAALAFTIKCDD